MNNIRPIKELKRANDIFEKKGLEFSPDVKTERDEILTQLHKHLKTRNFAPPYNPSNK